MGTALNKGDIDLMTRAMTPEQINKLAPPVETGKIDLVEMPASRSATSASTPTTRR